MGGVSHLVRRRRVAGKKRGKVGGRNETWLLCRNVVEKTLEEKAFAAWSTRGGEGRGEERGF